MELENEGKSLHTKVKEEILRLIKEKKFKPNTLLPTEAEFCKKFGVSRTTIRTALQQLSMEGYIYREQGRGTFVSDSKVKQTLSMTEVKFSEQLMSQGKKPLIKVLSLQVVPADEFQADQFQLKEGDPINKLERIRYADEEPLQYEIAYLPWYKTPGLNKEECQKSLYQLLEAQFGLKIKKTVEQLELFLADDEIADKLSIPVNTPCFSMESYAYLEDETPIEYSKAVFRGDRANFVIERNY
ncbi:GntR family transcriptional regulator [Shimazuella kribbensis]|uniref:GntR family transcriptional regulator n=1 Tax=Shimazuella kribbensis TaxID=139808 RepID=UPI00041F0339|nr:GntR family transcriptional regulator [Shimazuella kribbensis]